MEFSLRDCFTLRFEPHLKESGGRSGTGFREGKARSLLVVSEVSLALVLLICSALLIRPLVALHQVDSRLSMQQRVDDGNVPDRRALQNTAGISQLGQERPRPAGCLSRGGALGRRLLAAHRRRRFPSRSRSLGRPADKDHRYGSRWMSISPGYLEVSSKSPSCAAGISMKTYERMRPAVALINEAMAKRYWPRENPIGRQIAISKGLGAGIGESGADRSLE